MYSSIGRGATLAQRCAICRGPGGVSDASSPNLPRQYAGGIYKELSDFNAAVKAPLGVVTDAPMRNIAPCGSCHGGLDTKAGGPWLGGQSAVYIKAQLRAFVSGMRWPS